MNGAASAEAAYATLGLRFGAPGEDVRGAYRTLLRRYHPDTGAHDTESVRRLTEVKEAYERLRPRGPAPNPAAGARALDAYLAPPAPPTFDVLA